mmetsp:Transcript_46260/g.59463  ORF Transcript_46260/g.59463 Transcript_46260/m.59463 type:complete len:919 (+) Transcript_46260:649-3405(+)
MSVSWNLDITFPQPYNKFSSSLSFVQLDFINLKCLKGSYFLGVYAASFFPLLLAMIVWSAFSIRYTLMKCYGVEKGYLKKIVNEAIYASLVIIYLFLPPVAAIQFRALLCMKLEDGSSYLRADTGVNCNSDSYHFFTMVNGCLIAFYQCIPLFYIALLYRVREKLNPHHQSQHRSLAFRRRDFDKSLDSIRFLFDDYKLSRWYFEVVDLYRRILFTGVLPLIAKDTAIVAYLGSTLALISGVYFRELVPYRVEFTNFIAVIAQYAILLVFMSALMIETDSLDRFHISDSVLGIILVGINTIVMMFVILGGLQRYKSDGGHYAHESSQRVVHIEWAANFSQNKFQTTFDFVIRRNVPDSYVLAYYYTSFMEAKAILKFGGIPAQKLDPRLTVDRLETPIITSVKKKKTPQQNTNNKSNKRKVTHRDKMNDAKKEEESNVVFGSRGGIVVSLKGPHELSKDDPSLELMNSLSSTYEVVLCLVLPCDILWKLRRNEKESNQHHHQHRRKADTIIASSSSSLRTKHFNDFNDKLEDGENNIDGISISSVFDLRLLPVEALEALSPFSDYATIKQAAKSRSLSRSKMTRGDLTIPMLFSSRILRAYQLKDDKELFGRHVSATDLVQVVGSDPTHTIINKDIDMTKKVSVFRPENFKQYHQKLEVARQAITSLGLVPLYYFTSPLVSSDIVTRGIKAQTHQIGVYFSIKGPCSLGLGTTSFMENVITHMVGKDEVEQYHERGMLDLLIVYGAEPCCIRKSPLPGQVMIGQDRLEEFSKVNADNGNFYLRPDRIFAALILDENMQQQQQNLRLEDQFHINQEIENDYKTSQLLHQFEKETTSNALSILVKHQHETMSSFESFLGKYDEKDAGGGELNALNSEEEEEDMAEDMAVGVIKEVKNADKAQPDRRSRSMTPPPGKGSAI